MSTTPNDGDRRNSAAEKRSQELERLARAGMRQAKRVVILVWGSTVLAIGIAMIILPGPALVVIPLGLGILAIEFFWARRWLVRVRRASRRLTAFAQRLRQGRGTRAGTAQSVRARGS